MSNGDIFSIYLVFSSEGCFFDKGARLLSIDLQTSATNTPTECAQRCAYKGYILSGVQVGSFFSSDKMLSLGFCFYKNISVEVTD